ncbi:MAG: hypothetical protein V1790_17680 [Planctomycetota bacterium]
MSDCTVVAENCPPIASDCAILAESCTSVADNCEKTPETCRPFRWNTSSRKAAVLVAEDKISDPAIARDCNVSPRTVAYWKVHPEFRAEVEKHKSLISEDVLSFSIARRIERVRALDKIHTKLTGLVEVPEPNPAYLKEVREYQRQAAIEVGQWQESGQQLKPGEQRLTVTYDAVQAIQQADPERWARIERAAAGIMAEERGLPAGRRVVDAGTVGGGKP